VAEAVPAEDAGWKKAGGGGNWKKGGGGGGGWGHRRYWDGVYGGGSCWWLRFLEPALELLLSTIPLLIAFGRL
jgi:hypothetical protein